MNAEGYSRDDIPSLYQEGQGRLHRFEDSLAGKSRERDSRTGRFQPATNQ